jgi:putative methylase
MSNSTVYSLHKTSTRKFIEKKANEYGFEGEVIAEMRVGFPLFFQSIPCGTTINLLTESFTPRWYIGLWKYDLPKTMKIHKQKTLDIAVDFWRFQRIR